MMDNNSIENLIFIIIKNKSKGNIFNYRKKNDLFLLFIYLLNRW